MKRFAPVIDNGTGIVKAAWAVSALRCFSGRIHKTASFSSPYPTRVLNNVTGAFLRSDCDEMVIIDCDLEFEPHDLDLLLSHDLPVVFGCYPKKTIPLEWCCEPLGQKERLNNLRDFLNTNPKVKPPDELLVDDNPFGGDEPLVEVARCGRGFMRIHRDVFAKTFPDAPEYDYLDWREKEYWTEGTKGGEWLSEDWNFCDAWRATGGKVLIDQRIKLRHHGDYGFRSDGGQR